MLDWVALSQKRRTFKAGCKSEFTKCQKNMERVWTAQYCQDFVIPMHGAMKAILLKNK